MGSVSTNRCENKGQDNLDSFHNAEWNYTKKTFMYVTQIVNTGQ